MAETTTIPVLDCSFLTGTPSENINSNILKDFGDQLVSAFASHRVCYLKSHGIDNQLTEKFMATSSDFFTLPASAKEKFERKLGTIFGWVNKEKDIHNSEVPIDLKEGFGYRPADEGGWPNAELECYNKKMFAACTPLAKILCDALSLGLGQDRSFVWNGHKGAGGTNGVVVVRTNYYPPCPDETVLKPNQLRFFKHVDFTTLTLLFQDDVGGLEVEIPGQGFVPVTPMPGTVVVTPGDLLQRWYADVVKATVHRVVIPKSEDKRRKARQSIAYLMKTDADFEVKPMDGSEKYKAVTSLEYTREKLRELGTNL